MKKTNMNRLLAFVLAAMMLIGVCAGCNKDAYAELGQLTGATHSQQTTENKNDETKTDDTVADTQQNADSKKVEELQAQLAEVMEKISALEETNATLTAEAEESAKALEAVKAENEALKAENAADEHVCTPEVEVIDNVVYCDVEYFLERATVKFADGTAALMAIEKGTAVVLDDVHAIGERANYRDNTFDLPRKDYKIAVTLNGTDVQIADFSNYHWATNSLFLKSTATTGYKLLETKKSSSLGNFDQLLQAVAVCVPNAQSEYGYDFYVKVGNNKANPVVSKPATQPEKPTTEVVEKCGICKNLIADCTCKPNVVEIQVCGRCGELYHDCDCEPETIVEVETEVIYKKYCGRCDRLLKNCICGDDSDHNDLEEIPNPNLPNDDKDDEKEDKDPGHNDLEEVEPDKDVDTTLKPSDPSNDEGNHNDVNDETTNNTQDDEIDTTLRPTDASNDSIHNYFEEVAQNISNNNSTSKSTGHSALD